MNGAERIAAERKRQIEKEDWSAWHDDSENKDNKLALAAVCYALPRLLRHLVMDSQELLIHILWPWDYKWWKPTPNNRIRELEKAGALIAAEIDRLLRLEEEK